MMKKYLLPVTAICIVVLILFFIPGKNNFKLSTADILGRVVNHEHLITANQFEILKGEEQALLIDLRTPEEFIANHFPGAVNLPVGELNINTIRDYFKAPGSFVLYSGENTIANQVWILISQMGIKNVMVLTDSTILPDESPTYIFRPDTSLNRLSQ